MRRGAENLSNGANRNRPAGVSSVGGVGKEISPSRRKRYSAVSGLEVRMMNEYIEQITWHEVTTRKLTDEERAEYAERGFADYEVPEYIFDCTMPEDGQEILVVTRWGVGTDCCSVDGDGVNNLLELENRGDWDGVIAWAEMPKYKQEAER